MTRSESSAGRWLSRLYSRRGMASALIILLLVLLIFFGILSLVTAAADLRLSRKRAEWNQEYYLADAKATQITASLDQYCRTLGAADLESPALEDLLGKRLGAMANVSEFEIFPDGSSIRLVILTGADSDTKQEIRMELIIRTGQLAGDLERLTITGWNQRQQAAQSEDTGGGVWKG
ncbi:MAG TPA: hypothetical protein DD640_03750 [Clostridiales bacterium]|nr:hypothetical protein [Clostridiales bacterium]